MQAIRGRVCFAVLSAVGALVASACRPAPGPTGAPLVDADGRERAGTPAEPRAAVPVEQTTVEGITQLTLDNGLKVLLVPDPSRDRVTVNITYQVGSRHEGYGETGMAHLLEHMLFKGTERFPEASTQLEAHGAEYNGTTWYDRTNYFETMPATDENLRWALAFEADRMVHCPISPEHLSTEFSVVRNELEMGENSPFEILDERMLSTAFLWHNYGKSTIGAPSDLENVPPERLRKFYAQYYRPDNAVLVIAGAFDRTTAMQWVVEEFGAIETPTDELPKTYTVEPIQDGERSVSLRRMGDVGLVSVLYHGVAGADERYVAGEALVHLLTDEPSGRLYQALVEPGIASSVYGDTPALHDPGWVQFTAEVPADGSAERVREVLLSTLDDLKPPTAVEVARYRNRRAKQLGLALTDSTGVAIELSEWAALGDWRMLFVYRDRVDAVQADEVARFAEQFLVPSNRTVGEFVPTPEPARAPAVEVPNVAALVDGYEGRGALRDGEVFVASVENIESRMVRKTLPSGIQLAMLPKRTRGGAVTMQLRLRSGSVSSLRGTVAAAAYVGDMVMRGTRSHSRQALRDELDRLRAEVWISGAKTGAHVNITTVREHLPAVVRLVAEMLREPEFSRDEFRLLVQEDLAGWRAQRGDPQALAIEKLLAVLYPYAADDPRRRLTTEEWITALSRMRVRELRTVHQQQWGTEDIEIAAIGDFDASALEAALTETMGSWTAARSPERLPAEFHSVKPGTEIFIDTPDKEMAVVMMGTTVPMRDDDPDYPALVLGSYLLGGADASRLVMRLREREGWSYHAYADFRADAFEASGSMVLGAQCAPNVADKVGVAMAQELRTLLSEPVGQRELDTARATYRALFETQLSSDDGVAAVQLENLHLGRTLADRAALLDAMDAITPAELQQTLARRLSVDSFAAVVAGDPVKMGRGARAK